MASKVCCSWAQKPNFDHFSFFLIFARQKKGVFYLNERSFRAPDEVLQVVLHDAHHSRLDGDEQVFLLSAVLQDNGEGVVNRAVHTSQCPNECCHGRWSSKQLQALIDGMRAQPKSHAFTGDVIFRRPAGHPSWHVHVVVVLELGDFAEGAALDQMLDCLEVAVPSPVCSRQWRRSQLSVRRRGVCHP